jgi:hypothetical protein
MSMVVRVQHNFNFLKTSQFYFLSQHEVHDELKLQNDNIIYCKHRCVFYFIYFNRTHDTAI